VDKPDCQRASGRASRPIELGEVPAAQQRLPPRMAAVATRLLTYAFSVCGGTNDAFDNLHNHSLESKALMDNELQVLLWKMYADV
jgi:hypothetical protein